MYSTEAGCARPGPWAGLAFFPNARAGLGAEPGCNEPVQAKERDALRAELKSYTGNYSAQTPAKGRGFHWHEGHPDLRAFYADIIPRMDGLVDRPKLLRCSKRAREKAGYWLRDIRAALSSTKKSVPGRGSMTVVPAGGVVLTVYNSRKYHIRGPWYDMKFQPVGGGKEIPKPPAKDPNRPGGGGGARTPAAGGRGSGPVLPPELEGIWQSLTTGEFYGVPKAYLTYGVAGLLAYNLLFRKGRR